MNGLLKKIIAVLLIIILASANASISISYVFIEPEQDKAIVEREVTNKSFEENSVKKEIKSVAKIAISRTDLTTVVKNENIEIRAILDTSDSNYALYQNPTIKIKLPSYISKIDIKDYHMIMANGLEIKGEPKISNENGSLVISMILEGTQHEHTIGAEYEGTIMILNTDLTVDALTPSNQNKITMEVINENERVENHKEIVETELNFVAPIGIVTANGISNFAEGKADIISISDQSKVGKIGTYSSKRIAKVYGKLINNYENAIRDIVILGRFPIENNKNWRGETLGSTFSTKLDGNITIKGIEDTNYTIYYSENVDATTDLANSSNNWTTTVVQNAKSYMIILNQYEMKTGGTIDFSYQVEIPANLKHNQKVYEMYTVYYQNISNIGRMAEAKTSSIVGMATEEGPELTVELSSKTNVIREGQNVKMKAVVKNVGSTIAEGVNINITAPKNTKLVGTGYVKEETSRVVKIGTIKPNQSVDITYNLKADENIQFGLDESGVQNNTIAITNKVTVTADGVEESIPSNELVLSCKEGFIKLGMTASLVEGNILTTGEDLKYTIDVETLPSIYTELTNVVVNIPLHKGLEYQSVQVKDISLAIVNENEYQVEYDKTSNCVKVYLGTVSKRMKIIINTKVKETEEDISVMAMAKADRIEEHYSNEIEFKVEPVLLDISELTATPRYVKEGEKITYTFEITNIGNVTAYNLHISDVIPKEVDFQELIYLYNGHEEKITTLTDNRIIAEMVYLNPKESVKIKIIAKAKLLVDKVDKQTQNEITVTANGYKRVSTNMVTNIIEYNQELRNQINEQFGGQSQETDDGTIGSDNRYKITGMAWIDKDKNGKREEQEEVLSGVSILLLDKTTNKIVKDIDDGSLKRVTTDSKGEYEFTNLPKGEYFAIFLYDASRYNLTTYRAKEIDEAYNSDVININVTLDGKRTIAGTTDIIHVTNTNVRGIDMGVYTAEKFDLKIDKYISKITRTTPTSGTNTYQYKNGKVAKIEVLGRSLGKSMITIEYKIVITNEGAVDGYAKKVVDYLPEGVGFNTEINKGWYLLKNGDVCNTSLANEVIKSGEKKELTLVITKKITEDSLKNTLVNQAEIYEAYNEQGLQDIDSIPANKIQEEDDISQAEIVLSIATGTIIKYTALILGMMLLLGIGILLMKKKILDKRK